MSEELKGSAVVLTRDCPATVIPSGDAVVLKKETEVIISQALGGAVTVQTRGMLYRIGSNDLDALGLETDGGETSAGVVALVEDGEVDEEGIWEVLKTCFDPEIPINIVDLGLIYDLRIEGAESGKQRVVVKMTLTAQGCGMGPVIAEDAREKIEALPGVETAAVEVVWDPPWTPHMISPEGRERLGLE